MLHPVLVEGNVAAFSCEIKNVLHLELHLGRWCQGRCSTFGTIKCFAMWHLLSPAHRAERSLAKTRVSICRRSPLWFFIFIYLFWGAIYKTLNRRSGSTWQRRRVISFPWKVFSLSCPFPPFLPSLDCIGLFLFLYALLHWLGSPLFSFFFFPFPPLISPQCALSISVLCLCMALGIKSDSLRDWMCVAMACCIWKAIHSAGTLQFNLKQDWCWQTSHPLSSKMFLPLHAPIADGQKGICHFVMAMSRLLSRNNSTGEGT